MAGRGGLHCDRAVPRVQEIDDGLALQVEHVCLESDHGAVPPTRPRVGRDQGPTFRFTSRWRRCDTDLAFSADGQLTVRTRNRGKPLQRYDVDLRFVETLGASTRRIAWKWWLAAALSALAAASALLIDARSLGAGWDSSGLQWSVALLIVATGLGLVGLHQTRETLALRSLHGAARLAVVSGGLGTARQIHEFTAELSRRVEAARRQAPQSRQHFLRDEMREHHRLWREGVLPAADYEASKRRILAAHE